MGLPDLLRGRAFNILFRNAFLGELEARSRDMVDEVRTYMQSILQKLFGDACQAYPVLLDEVKTILVEEFMDFKQEQTTQAVSNVVNAELGWVFTQDRAYSTTTANVRDMVTNVRIYQAACRMLEDRGGCHSPVAATTVGDVPEAFINKLVASTTAEDEGIRNLQVGASP